MKVNKIWTAVGALSLFTGVTDLIFYWPVDDSELSVFLARKALNILIGSFLLWEYLIKPMRERSGANS